MAATLWTVPASASAAPNRGVNALYVFGDSYSDTGAGFVAGNGPTAVAYFARHLGLELVTPDEASGSRASINFAVSGAGTGEGQGQRIGAALIGLGMLDQANRWVERVRAGSIAFDPESTLFFLAGGLNDGKVPTDEVVANLRRILQTLHGAGARKFLIARLPEHIPQFTAVGRRLNPAIEALATASAKEFSDSKIMLSHWGSFFDDVLQRAPEFGIDDTENKCAGRAIFGEDATPCAAPERHFYYHANHPSTKVHSIVGTRLYEEWRKWQTP
jgi:phospholipase/lecithinase/hemolysin